MTLFISPAKPKVVPHCECLFLTSSIAMLFVHALSFLDGLHTYFYVKEELGDDSLLSPNYLSTAEIFVSEACRRAKVSRKTYYHWKPRYEKEGIESLREQKSHAVHNPHTIDPEIERRIIELRGSILTGERSG